VVDPHWLPIESIHKDNGRYEGMNADLLDLISELSGIKFELHPTKEWTESVALSKAGTVDMMACVSKTPEREEYLSFSETTIELTDGILMRSSAAFIDEVDDLKGLKVGVPEGTSVHAKLKKENPLLILVPIKGTQKAIEMLANGEIDAYAGNLEVSGYLLQQLGFFNLKVVLRLPDVRHMHIGLQKSLPPEALSVINKAIKSTSHEELQTIRQRWIGLKITEETDYILIAKIGLGIFLVILFILFNNYKLKQLVAQKTADIVKQNEALEAFNRNLEGLVQERTQEIANSNLLMTQLLNSIPSPIFYKNEHGVFIGFNQAYEKTFGIDSSTLLGKTVLDLEYLPLSDRKMYHEEDMNIIHEQSTLLREQEMVFADQKKHHTLYSVNAFKKSDNTPGGLIGIFTDITSQKEMEKEVTAMHQQTKDSIEYASLIQRALIPSNELFQKYFSDYLTLWNPKDIVGGDIYLFEELRHDDECLLMIIDCTGHGVPGAFVTMLVKAIERQLTANIINNPHEIVSPAKLLSIFNRSMKHLLKQENEESISNAGFDGAIIYVNKKESCLKFAGAQTSLFYVKDANVQTIKGDRHSVGYKKCDANFVYTEHQLELEKGMQFYVCTDGYLDQNGGAKGFPLGKTLFLQQIVEQCQMPMLEQKNYLIEFLNTYQGESERNDDVTVIGFKI